MNDSKVFPKSESYDYIIVGAGSAGAIVADTGFHYSGSARIGKDELAVVDPQLRVHGIGNLRVIDASVMPTIVSGNINAAVLMIGEKGADLIKAG